MQASTCRGSEGATHGDRAALRVGGEAPLPTPRAQSGAFERRTSRQTRVDCAGRPATADLAEGGCFGAAGGLYDTAVDPILSYVDGQHRMLVDLIRQFVECESPSDAPEEVNRFMELVADTVAADAKVKMVKASG